MSETIISARIRDDGVVVQILPDGGERPFPDTPMDPMTEEEISTAAWADPDARPFTPEELAKARRIPRVKTLRRALGLTQEEFSARYHIPIGTLRDWEQGRCEPDQPTRAYLRVIASDPEGVAYNLAQAPAGGRFPILSGAQRAELLASLAKDEEDQKAGLGKTMTAAELIADTRAVFERITGYKVS